MWIVMKREHRKYFVLGCAVCALSMGLIAYGAWSLYRYGTLLENWYDRMEAEGRMLELRREELVIEEGWKNVRAADFPPIWRLALQIKAGYDRTDRREYNDRLRRWWDTVEMFGFHKPGRTPDGKRPLVGPSFLF